MSLDVISLWLFQGQHYKRQLRALWLPRQIVSRTHSLTAKDAMSFGSRSWFLSDEDWQRKNFHTDISGTRYAGGTMKRTFVLSARLICLLAVCAAPASSAASTKPPKGFERTVVLWPNGAPGAIGRDDEDIPKLYVYPAPGDGAHPAVIVLPGGGYRTLATEKEGGEEARWLNARGVTAFVLEYRLGPRYGFPVPMLDGARAMRYVRSHAAELDVTANKIGLWGFSAEDTSQRIWRRSMMPGMWLRPTPWTG